MFIKATLLSFSGFLLIATANVLAQSHPCSRPDDATKNVPQTKSVANDHSWKFSKRRRVAILKTEFTSVAYYVPADPVRVLVLAHGYPWPDGTASDTELTDYVRADVQRWAHFAEENHVIILAPAFGSDFQGYREMAGCVIDPDEFVDRLVDGPAGSLIPHFNGRFNLHGHSAGAQFASRYVVTHPDRLDQAILSAPSTYPLPDPAIPWPDGMGPIVRDAFSGSIATGKSPSRAAGALYTPDPSGWVKAASQLSLTVVVGSRDIEPRPAAVGFEVITRLGRAKEWVAAMQRFARVRGLPSTVRLVVVPGLRHDEVAMAIPAQKIFRQNWR